MLQPHHDGSPLHVDTLAPVLGDRVGVRLRMPSPGEGEASEAPLAVRVRVLRDQDVEWIEASRSGAASGWDWWEATLAVRNPRVRYRWMIERAGGRVEWVNQAGLHGFEPRDADDFALLAEPAPPAWMTDAVMYQVFPDRFARSGAAAARPIPDWAIPAQWDDPVDPAMPGRSTQFYGGDLDGIVERLDHLGSLGVTLLYLTPFFPASSNHRYDASSFDRVDPLLGGDEALARLVRAAHERGIRVIGDLTTNHSGDRHAWFRAAYGHPEAPEGEFYYFFDGARTEYEGWFGHASLPKFDWSSEELRRRFVTGRDSVVRHWLREPYRLDGWRIDVANMTGRLGAVDLNAEVRGMIRDTVREENPEALLLAESVNDATDDLQGDGWHGAMSYAGFTRPLWAWLSGAGGTPYPGAEGETRTAPWFFGQPVSRIPHGTAREFRDAVVRFSAGIPWRVRLGGMQPLDTHDTARFASNARPGTVPVAVGLSMTLPGIPVLFAGDEFGLTGADGELSRTPIPWDSASEPEVASRLALYRELIGLRRAHAVLREGGLRWLHADDHALAFVRESAEETVLVVATSAAARFEIAAAALAGAEYGTAAIRPLARAGGIALGVRASEMGVAAEGPAFAAWSLPGVAHP